jgi:GNAT superfamily N-acetyltransferase
MEARLSGHAPDPAELAAATAVYGAAFGGPPYHEGPAEADAFAERVGRYARERDGFRLATVHDGGELLGVALAVLARPGDWWRDRAAAALDDEAVERWLGPLCLEVVHVAVLPAAQGRGLGRLLHDVLVAGTPAPTGLLGCDPAAEPARRLYTGRGWGVLTETFGADGDTPGTWLMARDL